MCIHYTHTYMSPIAVVCLAGLQLEQPAADELKGLRMDAFIYIRYVCFTVYMYTSICLYLSISLSLSIYIYIYTYYL